MPTLVEIGPSNASQGQHRRKEATPKLTLARSRTQDPVSGARYRYATGAVAYPEFFILYKLSSPQTYFAAFSLLVDICANAILVYLNNLLCPLLISLYSKAILINYMPTLNQRSC